MFHRSSRSTSRSAPATRNNVNATASATAHSAAAQAFLASRQSAPNLSASAAAAALRTMSPPPTDVGATQTKRTLQRQLSNSPSGSGARGRGTARPGIQRSGSSGSMTERTFRTPSPNRPGSRGGPGQAPPIPRLPDDYPDIPPIPGRSHRRVASMEPPPRRVSSPPLAKSAGRGQSLDRGPSQGSQLAAQKAAAAPRPPSLQKINELERSDSNNSINFSYPRNARPNSPPPRSPVARTGEHQFPLSMRSGMNSSNTGDIQYDVARAAEQPVKKKKKKVAPGTTEGSHFQSAGSGGRARVTPQQPGPAAGPVSGPPQQEPVKRKKKRLSATGETSHFQDSVSSQDGSDYDSTPEKTVERRTHRASGILNKQPSVVREDWEGEQGNVGPSSTARQDVDLGSNPMSSPGAAVQSKKASTAANVSRKIDEPISPPRPTQPSLHDAVTSPQPPLKQAENRKHLAVASSDAQHSRTASLSPSRSFRFSDHLSSDLAAGGKHEPLPRSVSPAKSALKHQSPSPHARSPMNGAFPSQTPSEASDSNSLISADGYGPALRKKKSARVSFDPEPEVVGVAAQEAPLESPPASPLSKDFGKRGWFGIGKSKSSALGTIPAEDDMEDVMTPRPALPFFGSVRNKPRDSDPVQSTPNRQTQAATTPATSTMSHNVPAASSSSSETSSSSITPTLNTSVSSDHAIGGLLAQEALRRQPSAGQKAIDLPLPPEVTSVEGTGYASDTDSNPEIEEQVSKPPPAKDSYGKAAHSQPDRVDATPVTISKPIEPVPTIAVHPATPGLEQSEARTSDQWQVQVPGGFPSSTDQLSNLPTPETRTDQPSLDVASTSPAGLGIAEPQPAETVGAVVANEPPMSTLSQQLHERDGGDSSDRNSDNDSIYSDAAESQADFDGDGFGSINAIVESPVVPPPSVNRVVTIPESPLGRNVVQNRREGSNRTASWDDTQAHWSGLAERYRQGVQQSPQNEEQTIPHQQAKPKTKKKSKALGAMAAAAAAVPASQRLVNSASQPQTSSRQQETTYSQNGRPSNGPKGQGFAKTSMKPQAALAPSPNLRSQPAPIAAPAPAPRQRGALQKRQIPSAIASPPKTMRPASSGANTTSTPFAARGQPIQRTFSNDSDSESSFRKQRRRAKGGGDGAYTMRRSMRELRTNQNAESQAPTEPGRRSGIRSLSPINRRPFSPVGGQKPMRTSMRESIDSNTSVPTMRGQPAQRSSSLFSRSKAKSPVSPAPTPLPLTTKIRSRIGDSDDEGTTQPKSFRSRFEDSSDDEPEPVQYRPVRGIPRKTDEGDSTDLEDSSDEEASTPQPKALLKINTQQANAAPSDMLEAPLSPNSEKKRGFFDRFRSKKVKDRDSKSRLGVGTIAERDAMLDRTRPDVQAAKDPENISTPNKKMMEDKTRASRLGFGSIAERDAMIERTRAQLEETRENAGPQTSSQANGGSQRRATPQRIMSDSWPLPPKMLAANGDRPSTADGFGSTATANSKPRPGMNGRENTSESLRSAGGTPIYGRSGKKKRFPMLRRAFGLTD